MHVHCMIMYLCIIIYHTSINPLIAVYILNEETNNGVICCVILILGAGLDFTATLPCRAEEATESCGALRIQ